MHLHPIVETILTTKQIPLSDGRKVTASSHIPRDECELLYRLIAESRATRAVEVGMAFGISSLCLCDALSQNADRTGSAAKLVVMDPAQNDAAWQGIGLKLVREAGFGGIVEFHERPSQLVLPELVQQGVRTDLVFIDGWHTFDHTLVDFFFADQLLEPGGIVVFDDVGYQAINSVVRFVLSNRSYELVGSLECARPGTTNQAKRVVKRWINHLGRTDKTPLNKHQRDFHRFEFAHSVAVRKLSNDQRRWDHYAHF